MTPCYRHIGKNKRTCSDPRGSTGASQLLKSEGQNYKMDVPGFVQHSPSQQLFGHTVLTGAPVLSHTLLYHLLSWIEF
jgi:hypothetical protein